MYGNTTAYIFSYQLLTGSKSLYCTLSYRWGWALIGTEKWFRTVMYCTTEMYPEFISNQETQDMQKVHSNLLSILISTATHIEHPTDQWAHGPWVRASDKMCVHFEWPQCYQICCLTLKDMSAVVMLFLLHYCITLSIHSSHPSFLGLNLMLPHWWSC